MKLGLPGVLLVVFIVLKLTSVIAWSWLWVLSPLWIPIVIFLVISVIYFAVAGSAEIHSTKKRKKRLGF